MYKDATLNRGALEVVIALILFMVASYAWGDCFTDIEYDLADTTKIVHPISIDYLKEKTLTRKHIPEDASLEQKYDQIVLRVLSCVGFRKPEKTASSSTPIKDPTSSPAEPETPAPSDPLSTRNATLTKNNGSVDLADEDSPVLPNATDKRQLVDSDTTNLQHSPGTSPVEVHNNNAPEFRQANSLAFLRLSFHKTSLYDVDIALDRYFIFNPSAVLKIGFASNSHDQIAYDLNDTTNDNRGGQPVSKRTIVDDVSQTYTQGAMFLGGNANDIREAILLNMQAENEDVIVCSGKYTHANELVRHSSGEKIYREYSMPNERELENILIQFVDEFYSNKIEKNTIDKAFIYSYYLAAEYVAGGYWKNVPKNGASNVFSVLVNSVVFDSLSLLIHEKYESNNSDVDTNELITARAVLANIYLLAGKVTKSLEEYDSILADSKTPRQKYRSNLTNSVTLLIDLILLSYSAKVNVFNNTTDNLNKFMGVLNEIIDVDKTIGITDLSNLHHASIADECFDRVVWLSSLSVLARIHVRQWAKSATEDVYLYSDASAKQALSAILLDARISQLREDHPTAMKQFRNAAVLLTNGDTHSIDEYINNNDTVKYLYEQNFKLIEDNRGSITDEMVIDRVNVYRDLAEGYRVTGDYRNALKMIDVALEYQKLMDPLSVAVAMLYEMRVNILIDTNINNDYTKQELTKSFNELSELLVNISNPTNLNVRLMKKRIGINIERNRNRIDDNDLIDIAKENHEDVSLLECIDFDQTTDQSDNKHTSYLAECLELVGMYRAVSFDSPEMLKLSFDDLERSLNAKIDALTMRQEITTVERYNVLELRYLLETIGLRLSTTDSMFVEYEILSSIDNKIRDHGILNRWDFSERMQESFEVVSNDIDNKFVMPIKPGTLGVGLLGDYCTVHAIKKNVLLVAAHCVYDPITSQFTDDMTIRYNSYACGTMTYQPENVIVFKSFTMGKSTDFDFAGIILSEELCDDIELFHPIFIEKLSKKLQFQYADYITGQGVVRDYIVDPDSYFSNTVLHSKNCTATTGNSGSPVFTKDRKTGKNHLHAIHTRKIGLSDYCAARRITPDMIKMIIDHFY